MTHQDITEVWLGRLLAHKQVFIHPTNLCYVPKVTRHRSHVFFTLGYNLNSGSLRECIHIGKKITS